MSNELNLKGKQPKWRTHSSTSGGSLTPHDPKRFMQLQSGLAILSMTGFGGGVQIQIVQSKGQCGLQLKRSGEAFENVSDVSTPKHPKSILRGGAFQSLLGAPSSGLAPFAGPCLHVDS